MKKRIDRSLKLKTRLQFVQLFNYRYADGAQMVTLGGIVADKDLNDRIARSGILSNPAVVTGSVPESITVPPLTTRERDWIDRHIQGPLMSSDLPFELDQSLLDSYRRGPSSLPDLSGSSARRFIPQPARWPAPVMCPYVSATSGKAVWGCTRRHRQPVVGRSDLKPSPSDAP